MQVLLGLQANALKFTREGSVKIIVTIIEEKGIRKLQIAVQDTGIGISEQDQKKLFKLFGFLEDQQRMNTKGIGLGLVIAK
jgi:signal transduction histidine kinase